MKKLNLDELQPDSISAALFKLDKETITISGYICAADEATISVCEVRHGNSYTEIPRSAVIAAFKADEKSDQVTLIIEADARVKSVTTGRMETFSAQRARRANNNSGCGTTCESYDGLKQCCCGVGQRCESKPSTCVCADASNPLTGLDFTSIMRPSGEAESNFAAQTTSADRIRIPPFNWGCSSNGRPCPIMCYPIVVNGRIVDYYCICDCSHPIPNGKSMF